MKLHLEPVTAQNREEILRLGVLPGQKGYIETVAQCMEEAGEYGGWRPVGIYDGDLPVGFSMYGFFREEYPPEGRLWLDRLLIDARFQGRGYPEKDVYLSVIEGNDVATRLYEQYGFRFIGEKDIHGEDVMVRAWDGNLIG